MDKNKFENSRTRICSKPVISKTLYSEAFLQVKPELVNLCTYTKWFYKDEKTTHSQLLICFKNKAEKVLIAGYAL